MGWIDGVACPCIAAIFWKELLPVFCKESNVLHLQHGIIFPQWHQRHCHEKHIESLWGAQFNRDLEEVIKTFEKNSLGTHRVGTCSAQTSVGDWEQHKSWDTGHIVKAWRRHQRIVWNVDKVQPSAQITFKFLLTLLLLLFCLKNTSIPWIAGFFSQSQTFAKDFFWGGIISYALIIDERISLVSAKKLLKIPVGPYLQRQLPQSTHRLYGQIQIILTLQQMQCGFLCTRKANLRES